MSNNNKNKPSTITKLIDYFNDNDEEEEEEEEEEIYPNQTNEMSSLGISGKFSRLYSYRDENEIEEEPNENKENNVDNNLNENKIFTTLYPNEQPDSSFCCEEHPKGENKLKNNTEFIGRAVSFHRKKEKNNDMNNEELNENNNLINEEDKNKISYEFREDNKEISKINKENTFTNTGINNIDIEASFSKEKSNFINSAYNNENNNTSNNINNNINKEKEKKEEVILFQNNNINNNENNHINNIDNNINKNNNNDNNKIKVENNNNNNKINSFNINDNSYVSNYNIIYNNDKVNNSYNKDYDSMVNNTYNNGYLMGYDEKTLEDEETQFLELEKQRKEKEKIKKKKEQLLEQLRIKQEEKKALEKKLEEKKHKDLNNKEKIKNENIPNDNNNNRENLNQIEIYNQNNNNINNINENIKNIENENNNNKNEEIIYDINNNDNIFPKKEENIKENELIDSNNYQKFDSFKNINNLINNNNNSKKNEIEKNYKPNIYDKIDKKLFNPEYLIDSNTFDAIQKSENNLHYKNTKKNKIEESKKSINDSENKNVKIIKNLVNLNLNPEKQKQKEKKTNKLINNKEKYMNEYNTYKNPIELTLYNDALKRRKKLENIDKTVMKGIKLNSNKTKMTNASYRVAIEHDEKIIDKIINRYSILNKKNNTKYINIIGIALSLRDMKIFRELFNKDKYSIYNNKNLLPLLTLKQIILSTEKKEIRKIKEINFLQQTWLLLNKEEKKEYLNKDIFFGLLKIIFSPEGTIKEIEELLNKYLEAVQIGMNLFNSKNSINTIIINKNKKDITTKELLISPIDNKNISYNNLWSLVKYLKTFFELKKNLIAYKTTDNLTNLNKEKYKEKILKHQKIKSNIVNTNYTLLNQKNEKADANFDKLYQKFLEKEQCRKNVLEEMRKKREIDLLKELKEKPTISKLRGNTICEKDFALMGKKKENIHDRLYKMDKDIKAKKQELIEEKEKLEQEKIKKEQKRNKLRINSRLSKLRMNKSFDHPQKCKGFDEFVKRNRNGRLEWLRVQYLLEKAPQGEKYEEIMRRNITPPNITDIRKMKQKIKSKKSFNNESDGNTEYFNLQIKLPNGKIQTIKVYENDDPNDVVEEFCKIHTIDDNIKYKLVANIKNCQKQFLMKENKSNNESENENDDEENEEEEEEGEEQNILLDEN